MGFWFYRLQGFVDFSSYVKNRILWWQGHHIC
jgi:hypothetical protein